jgi:hypothetical protein
VEEGDGDVGQGGGVDGDYGGDDGSPNGTPALPEERRERSPSFLFFSLGLPLDGGRLPPLV